MKQLGLIALSFCACNGVCGLDEVEVRGGGGAGVGGDAEVAGSAPTGSGGTDGGGSIGEAQLCGEPPSDNMVVDGGFENGATNWIGYDTPFDVTTFASEGEEPCQGLAFGKLTQYDEVGEGWGDGNHQPLLAAETECVAWSFSGRAHSPNLNLSITLAFEGDPYTVNYITGNPGVFVQDPTWALFEGACRLTVPGFIDHINIFLQASPDTVLDIDSLVVRPIECGPQVPDCPADQP